MDANVWWLLTVACLVWYSTVTIYVSVRGLWDIKNMFARLAALKEEGDKPPTPPADAH